MRQAFQDAPVGVQVHVSGLALELGAGAGRATQVAARGDLDVRQGRLGRCVGTVLEVRAQGPVTRRAQRDLLQAVRPGGGKPGQGWLHSGQTVSVSLGQHAVVHGADDDVECLFGALAPEQVVPCPRDAGQAHRAGKADGPPLHGIRGRYQFVGLALQHQDRGRQRQGAAPGEPVDQADQTAKVVQFATIGMAFPAPGVAEVDMGRCRAQHQQAYAGQAGRVFGQTAGQFGQDQVAPGRVADQDQVITHARITVQGRSQGGQTGGFVEAWRLAGTMTGQAKALDGLGAEPTGQGRCQGREIIRRAQIAVYQEESHAMASAKAAAPR